MNNKKIYSSGNLRAVVAELPDKHPDYSEDTYEIIGKPWFIGGRSIFSLPTDIVVTEENKRVLSLLPIDREGNLLFSTNIVEFTFDTYKIEPLWDSMPKKKRKSIDLSKYGEKILL